MLVAAVVAALVWANVAPTSYDAVWDTRVALRIGDAEFGQDLREWVNGGLMTLFFLVVGLEARREFDLGDLRERRRFVLPLVAGVVGMAVPIGIFLLFNAGLPSAHGWGVAMSTDTALALGLLAILGRHVPDKVRLFLLTIFVVDDLAALLVIAVVYSEPIEALPLALAVVVFALLLVVARSMRRRSVYFAIGLALWLALVASGVDPVVAGLAIGLSAPAYTPSRDALEQATGRVRQFREQPTPELVREATDEPHRHAVAERPAAELLPPVDELRDRPAVRAGQRGRRAVGRLPRARLHHADHPRRARRVRGRQAAGRGGRRRGR